MNIGELDEEQNHEDQTQDQTEGQIQGQNEGQTQGQIEGRTDDNPELVELNDGSVAPMSQELVDIVMNPKLSQAGNRRNPEPAATASSSQEVPFPPEQLAELRKAAAACTSRDLQRPPETFRHQQEPFSQSQPVASTSRAGHMLAAPPLAEVDFSQPPPPIHTVTIHFWNLGHSLH